MSASPPRFVLIAVAALIVLVALTTASQAQFIRPPANVPFNQTTNNLSFRYGSRWVAPYMSLNEYAYRMRVLGDAYSRVPPNALYNPYLSPVPNFGPNIRPYPQPWCATPSLSNNNPYLNRPCLDNSYLNNPYLNNSYLNSPYLNRFPPNTPFRSPSLYR